MMPRLPARSPAVLALAMAGFLQATPAGDLPSSSRILLLHHTTTSDWSEISISPAPAIVALSSVGGGGTGRGLSVSATRISRPPGDRASVSADVAILLADPPTALDITSTRGALGQSTVTVATPRGPITLANKDAGSDDNRQVLRVPLDAVASLPPFSPATGILPTRRVRTGRLTLRTTSDWTDLDLVSDSPCLLSFRGVPEGSGTRGLAITETGIHKKSFDRTPVTVEYDLFAASQPSMIFVHCRKGAVGGTMVALPAPGGQTRTLLQTDEEGWLALAPDPSGWPSKDFSEDLAPRTVFAFYYPWYGTRAGPEGAMRHWPEGQTHAPALGSYSSRDEATLRQHLAWCDSAGIDVLLCSWWGPGSYEDVSILDHLAPGITRGDSRIRLALYVEEATSARALKSQLKYIHETYSGNPAYFQVGGKPVVFFYSRVLDAIPIGELAQVLRELRASGVDMLYLGDSLDPRYLEVFDGLHTYNPVGLVMDSRVDLARTYQQAWLSCRKQGKVFMASVLPGYDDSHLERPRPSPLVLDRRDGAVYQATWKAATASFSEWVGITTFNEWHEGSEIEPSTEFGNRYLDLTREWAGEFKAGKGKGS